MKYVGYNCEKCRIPRFGFVKMLKSLFLQFLSWKLSWTVGSQSLSNNKSWEQIIGLKMGVRITVVMALYEIKKFYQSQNLHKLSNLTYTWLKNNLIKHRSGITKVNLRQLMKYQRIWGNVCIVSKVKKLNVFRVWCPYFLLSGTKDCRNLK